LNLNNKNNPSLKLKEEESKQDIPVQVQVQDQVNQSEVSQLVETQGEWKNIWRVSRETASQTNKNMELFRTLNRDTSIILLSFLELSDISCIGNCLSRYFISL